MKTINISKAIFVSAFAVLAAVCDAVGQNYLPTRMEKLQADGRATYFCDSLRSGRIYGAGSPVWYISTDKAINEYFESRHIDSETKSNMLDRYAENLFLLGVNANSRTIVKTKGLAIADSIVAADGIAYLLSEVPASGAESIDNSSALAARGDVWLADSLTEVFSWATSADDAYITNPNSSPLNYYFDDQLLEHPGYALFIPTDSVTYYDVVSSQNAQPRMLSIYYSTRRADLFAPVKAYAYKWNTATNEVGDRITASVRTTQINNRLKYLLGQSVIFPSGDSGKVDIDGGNEYFVSGDGSPLRVVKTGDAQKPYRVYGGFQVEHPDVACYVTKSYGYVNGGKYKGSVYYVDKPVQRAMSSIYSVLEAGSGFSKFFQLAKCDSSLIERSGLAAVKSDEFDNYLIFANNYGLTDNVGFLQYSASGNTLFVPTNSAMDEAIGLGLPTWEQIGQVVADGEAAAAASGSQEDSTAITREYQQKAQAMIFCLEDFLKYHFQQDAVFADSNRQELTEHLSYLFNAETMKRVPLQEFSDGDKTLSVRDNAGNVRSIVKGSGLEGTPAGGFNIFATDYVLNTRARNATTIECAHSTVVHGIDGVLLSEPLTGGRFDSAWDTAEHAAEYVAKHKK